MDRRSFFRSMIGGVAATAAVRTWPFRVFSFPNELAMPLPLFAEKYIRGIDLTALEKQYRAGVLGKVHGFDWYFDEVISVESAMKVNHSADMRLLNGETWPSDVIKLKTLV